MDTISWPQWNGCKRGQRRFPVKWTEADYNWKVELPGLGHSSPAIWGDKVFLLSADPDTATRYMLCYSATDGSLDLETRVQIRAASFAYTQQLCFVFASVDEDHVYVGWSTPAETTFKAFNHDGTEAWSLNLGRWVSQHGFGASPILYEDLVILHNSQQANELKDGEKPGDSFMMAFKRDTGKEVWRVPLVSVNVCYSVPFIYTPEGGADELVCISTGNGVFQSRSQDRRKELGGRRCVQDANRRLANHSRRAHLWYDRFGCLLGQLRRRCSSPARNPRLLTS